MCEEAAELKLMEAWHDSEVYSTMGHDKNASPRQMLWKAFIGLFISDDDYFSRNWDGFKKVLDRHSSLSFDIKA